MDVPVHFRVAVISLPERATGSVRVPPCAYVGCRTNFQADFVKLFTKSVWDHIYPSR